MTTRKLALTLVALLLAFVVALKATPQVPAGLPDPAQEQLTKVRDEWRDAETRLLRCMEIGAKAQAFRVDAISGASSDTLATVTRVTKATEDRLVALFTKEHPDLTLDPKTGKTTPKKAEGK